MTRRGLVVLAAIAIPGALGAAAAYALLRLAELMDRAEAAR